MLLQRRSLRSRLDLLRSVSARELCVSRAQHSQQQHAGGVLRDLAPGEPVWARSFRQPDKWLKGTVANNQGTNRYVVNSGDGRLIPRHIDQIRRRSRMSNVPCPSGTNSDQFEGQVSIGSEDALADSNIPDVGSNDDVAEAISVTKSNSEISVPKPVEDPSEPTCTPMDKKRPSRNKAMSIFQDASSRESTPDPFSDADGEYGSDQDYDPDPRTSSENL
ncbi:hypothetical protein ACJJTC_013738 [Scirpophaga incertulas]